jgi:surface protein
MFNGCSNFNSDLSRWQFKHLEHTNFMFYDCENFNSDLSGWDVSKVKVMNDMFVGCKNLTSDFSSWNVSNVFDMRNMFDECSKTNLYSVIPWIQIRNITLQHLFNGMENTLSVLYLLHSAQMYDNMTYLYLTLDIQDIMEYI